MFVYISLRKIKIEFNILTKQKSLVSVVSREIFYKMLKPKCENTLSLLYLAYPLGPKKYLPENIQS